MSEMSNFGGPPPPPGLNPGYPSPNAGYPGAGYPGPNPGYPGPGAPIVNPPMGDPGYPPPGAYPPPMADGYQPQPGYPPPAGYPGGPMMFQPTHGSGYPQPGTGYMQPGAGYMQPGVQPPDGGEWMPMPTGVPVCPPGLEYLTMIDHLLVKQKVELLEAIMGFETNNKYTVKNNLGQKIYTAKEDTDCCTRNCLGPIRPFDIKIKDLNGIEVIHLYRPCRCDSCFCPCCLQKLEVMSPPGTTVGYVVQEWSILAPKYRIENAAGDTVLRIEGPICTYSICGDVEFQVLSKDGEVEVGKITKQWSGLVKEAFTDADNFGISFPLDLDVNIKAVLLGACFLIDFMFFEKQGNKEQDAPGML